MGPRDYDDEAENGVLHGEQQHPWQYEYRDDGPEASTTGESDMQMQSSSSDAGDEQYPLPIWLRESKSFHWRWVPVRIRQAARVVKAWCEGPDPPQIQKITPFFPWIQEAPVRLIDTYLPKRRQKAALLAFFYFSWLLTFTLVLNHSAQAGDIEGYGKPQPIWCGASLW